jgi:hypothetical protein
LDTSQIKKAVAAGGGLSVGLLLWMLSTITANHNDLSKALSDVRERLARIESRQEYHHGEPTPAEVAAEDRAVKAETLTEPRP